MTLRFMDGFDHYATADLLAKWNAQNSGASNTIQSAAGRRSGGAIRVATNGFVLRAVPAHATYTLGIALKVTSLPSITSNIAEFHDGANQHLSLRLDPTGHIIVARSTSTVLGTSTYAVTTGSYFYLEFKFTIDNTTGSYEVRADGVNVLSGTGADTQNAGNASVNAFILGATSGSAVAMDVDDLYLCDGAGSTNNSFLGDCRIDAIYPNGNGNSSQLVGSDSNSTDNYLLVDETAPSTADYVKSATATEKDTYTFTDISHTPTSIFGIQLCPHANKDDAGSRSLASVTRSASTDYDGTTIGLSTDWRYLLDIREQDPATSAAWTKTNLNAAQFGVKVAA